MMPYSCLPPVIARTNTLKLTVAILVEFLIVQVFRMCAYPEIGFPIIQAVVIDVVCLTARRDIHNDTMHIYHFLLAILLLAQNI